MSSLLWAKVYFKEHFVGVLREEPGGGTSFVYDESYLNLGQPAIAMSFPLDPRPYISHLGLHPFFDNLVAEGWLEDAQTKLLGKRIATRFELLLAFGEDCAGAVSIVDPEHVQLNSALLDMTDPKELALMVGRASLSGVQPKLTLVEKNGILHPAKVGETSTHIAKFPSLSHDDLVINEYLTTRAFKKLLPEDDVVELRLGEIKGFKEQALIIKRFDRDAQGNRLHFEEFNQLLDHASQRKYEGAYKDMADFMYKTKGCLPTEVYKLYTRIIAGLLLGNTDMHLKNFAMFHTPLGLRLTPSYDQVAAAIYQYKTVAMTVYRMRGMKINNIKPINIVKLGEEFALSHSAIKMSVEQLGKNIDDAKQAIVESQMGAPQMKDKLITMLGEQWNRTFALIGQHLSKKR